MDLTGFTDQAKKTLLRIFFPAIILLIPFALLLTQILKDDKYSWLKDEFSFLSFFSVGAAIIILYGLGHSLNKLGARVEIFLEKRYCAKNGVSHEDFMKVFDRYLLTYFSHDTEPVLIRYYSEMLAGLKFEINTSVSLTISFFVYCIVGHYYPVFIIDCRIFIVAAFVTLTIVYLMKEARDGVSQLNEYRQSIIDIFNKRNPKDAI